MKSQKLLRLKATYFIKSQAPMAFCAFLFGATITGVVLHSEGIKIVGHWLTAVLIIHSISFLLRHYNREIFATEKQREQFGVIANFLESCVAGSSLLFIPHISIGAGILICIITYTEYIGCVFTTAGYKPLFWSFAGPLITLQLLSLGFCYYKSGSIIYGGAAFYSFLGVLILPQFAQRIREMILSTIDSQLAAQRAVQSKSRFFMASSHDLRQPVAASAAFISSALNICDDAKVQDNLLSAKHAIDLIDRQIAPMMELARIDSGDVGISNKEFDLNDWLATTTKLFEARLNNDTQIILSLPENDSLCVADTDILTRILSNILDNSLKYTESGEISVTLSHLRTSYLLKVRDSGIGIEEKQLDLIFDEFYQVDNRDRDARKGYGLGLTITQRLCDLLGITFSLESKIGQFTLASLEIPRRAS